MSNLTLSVDSIRVSLNEFLFERVQQSTSSKSRPIADRNPIRKIARDLYLCDCRSSENRFFASVFSATMNDDRSKMIDEIQKGIGRLGWSVIGMECRTRVECLQCGEPPLRTIAGSRYDGWFRLPPGGCHRGGRCITDRHRSTGILAKFDCWKDWN